VGVVLVLSLVVSTLWLTPPISILGGVGSEEVEFEYELDRFRGSDQSRYVTLHKQGDKWVSGLLSYKNVSVPDENISELKNILSNGSKRVSPSRYRQNLSKIREIRSNYTLAPEEREEHLKNIDIEGGKYDRFDHSEDADHRSSQCRIEFRHNSTHYIVTQENDECRHDVWLVKKENVDEDEGYVAVSERVTRIFAEAINKNYI